MSRPRPRSPFFRPSVPRSDPSSPDRTRRHTSREHARSHRRAVLGGLLGSVLGAGLWAIIALVTNYEIGWIAWAVSALVGYGVALGNRGAAHPPGRTAAGP